MERKWRTGKAEKYKFHIKQGTRSRVSAPQDTSHSPNPAGQPGGLQAPQTLLLQPRVCVRGRFQHASRDQLLESEEWSVGTAG